MSLHVVMRNLAPGKGSQISHLISLPIPHFPRPVPYSLLIQVLNSRKCGLNSS